VPLANAVTIPYMFAKSLPMHATVERCCGQQEYCAYRDKSSGKVAAVDPGQPDAIQQALEAKCDLLATH